MKCPTVAAYRREARLRLNGHVGEMMMNANRLIGSAVFLVLGILAMSYALFLATRGGGWLSFIFSCPFWSVAILLFLVGFRLYRAALFGFVGAAVVGGVAFLAGFFGPIIFMPNANQGPLLGIFLGPIGVLVGTILGLLAAMIVKGTRQQCPPPLPRDPRSGHSEGEG